MSVLLHAGYTVVVADDDGAVRAEGRQGVYDFDARLLGRFAYRFPAGSLRLVGSTREAPHRWSGRLVAASPGRTADISGPALPQDVIELAIDRGVGAGLVDRLTVSNRSAAAVSTALHVQAEPDFADVQEVGRERRITGEVDRHVDPGSAVLTWTWRGEHNGRGLERGVRVRVEGVEAEASGDGFRIPLTVEPHGMARLVVTVESLVEGTWRGPAPEDRDEWLRRWDDARASVESGSPLCAAVERAAHDLAALRNDELFGGDDEHWYPNAGVPVFTGYFGRDSVTAGWQAGMLSPAMTRGALEVAARTQSKVDDPWRDAEPGKLVHEIRRGPLSMLEMIPQSAYYGTQTTGAMFVLALSESWHWTRDLRFVRRHAGTARRAIEWAERFGDLDGDGFVEYRRRSPEGLKNQAWKDSDEAIRYPDGSVVDNPIATVEEQAFQFLALERLAEIELALGEDDRAEVLLGKARRLRHRWHEAFWLEDQQFYALALDPSKRRVASISSNPGHALGAGLVPAAQARAVADRLMAPDLFSGWGVRTLSTAHPSYNPYAYHLGSVWPVEQATFALGFKRYGLDEHVDRLVEGMLAAAAASPERRLPELIAGIAREEFPAPVRYPDANAPQAWSASATVQLLQVSLGLYPFAPLGVLALVRPRLPASVPEVTIRRLRVGRAAVSIRFRREPDGSASHEVLEREGRLAVIEAAPPGAEDDVTWRERLERMALRRLPGRRARAARIALGFESR